jgi:hypothetical protein
MSSVRTQFALRLLHACVLCLSVSSWAQETQEQAESSLPASPPLPLAKLPAGPIFSLYQNGELTIEAQNANLSDVLRVVSSQTGALIDIPQCPDERVVGVFGPARVQDVLTSLLNGSRFNYIMQGAAAYPDRPERVTLSLRDENPAKSENPAVDLSQSRPRASAPSVVAQDSSGPPLRGRFRSNIRRSQSAPLQPAGIVGEKR